MQKFNGIIREAAFCHCLHRPDRRLYFDLCANSPALSMSHFPSHYLCTSISGIRKITGRAFTCWDKEFLPRW